jgi:hypothetical protein
VEASGIPTVALATLAVAVKRVVYPRAAVARFPRGATCGPPNAPELQHEVIGAALELLRTATRPGTLVELPQRFGEAA